MSKIKSSGLYSKRLQLFKKKPFFTLNKTGRLLVFIIPLLLVASLLQVSAPALVSAQVNNSAASNFCTSQYSRPNSSTNGNSSTSEYSACVDGYVNGNGQGAVCGRYEEKDFDAACRAGYNAKKEAEQNPSNANNPAPTTPTDTPTGTPSTASPDAGADTDPNDKDAVTCAVEKIGWIVCPIVEQSANMSDKLFQFLAGSFLEIEPELLQGGPDNGTKQAWDQALTLANIAFVIAFVIIIISQVTGSGISNYGIKRMLPRLIVAAIAVNASYWICQGMVDLSNILGYNIMEALKGIAHNVGPSAFENNQASNVNEANGFLGGLTVAILAAAAVVWLFLAIMGGTIFIILITCLVIIIILLMRKAFIILLVVISPFAFVAYLLPNTEKLFSKWLNMFWQLLLVFPIVALLLGGGQLASAIILNAGSDPVIANPSPEEQEKLRAEQEACDANDTTQNAVKNEGYEVRCEPKVKTTKVDPQSGQVTEQESGAMYGLVAAGVAVAPLLAVWAVLKGALAAAGAIGGKIAGAVQAGGGRLGKAGGSKMGDRMGRSALGRGMAARKAIKKNYQDEKFYEKMGGRRRGGVSRFAARGISGNIGMASGKLDAKLGDGKLSGAFNVATGGMQARSGKFNDMFSGQADKLRKEEIQNSEAGLRNSNDPIGNASKKLEEALASGDEIAAKAAQNVLMSSGGKGMDEFVAKMASKEEDAIKSGNGELIAALKQNALQNHGTTMKERSGTAAGWSTSENTIKGVSSGYMRAMSTTTGDFEATGPAANPYESLSDTQISSHTGGEIQHAIANNLITPEAAKRITTTSAGEKLGQQQRAALVEHGKKAD